MIETNQLTIPDEIWLWDNKYIISVKYSIWNVWEADQTNEKQVEVNFEIANWIFQLILIWFCSKKIKSKSE